MKQQLCSLVMHNLDHTEMYINPFPAKLNYLNFYPFEVVSRYRDPQLQVAENYSYFFYFEHKYLQILMFRHTFHSK